MGTYSVSVSDTDGVSSSFVLDEEGNVLLTQAGHPRLCHAFRDRLSKTENTFGQEEGWAWGLLMSQKSLQKFSKCRPSRCLFLSWKVSHGRSRIQSFQAAHSQDSSVGSLLPQYSSQRNQFVICELREMPTSHTWWEGGQVDPREEGVHDMLLALQVCRSSSVLVKFYQTQTNWTRLP